MKICFLSFKKLSWLRYNIHTVKCSDIKFVPMSTPVLPSPTYGTLPFWGSPSEKSWFSSSLLPASFHHQNAWLSSRRSVCKGNPRKRQSPPAVDFLSDRKLGLTHYSRRRSIRYSSPVLWLWTKSFWPASPYVETVRSANCFFRKSFLINTKGECHCHPLHT